MSSLSRVGNVVLLIFDVPALHPMTIYAAASQAPFFLLFFFFLAQALRVVSYQNFRYPHPDPDARPPRPASNLLGTVAVGYSILS